MKELYYSYQLIHKLVEKLSIEIKKDSYEPDYIIAIGTGGFIPARILKNYINKNILVITIKRYEENKPGTNNTPFLIQRIDNPLNIIKGKKILLIDEIDDTRISLVYCLKKIFNHLPKEIRCAVIHNKLKIKKADFPGFLRKIYYAEEVPDVWIHYPWEASNIDEHYKHYKHCK